MLHTCTYLPMSSSPLYFVGMPDTSGLLTSGPIIKVREGGLLLFVYYRYNLLLYDLLVNCFLLAWHIIDISTTLGPWIRAKEGGILMLRYQMFSFSIVILNKSIPMICSTNVVVNRLSFNTVFLISIIPVANLIKPLKS